ncbi:MAG: glycosyl hydrolase, partial [Burkholderiales bacterium]|nr:glycosyl hydrolase [Burkholderiales bacterium]
GAPAAVAEPARGENRGPGVGASAEAAAGLAGEFRATLEAGIHGLCFSPYLQGQAPGTQVGAVQIRARLELIRPWTRWIRSFACTEGHEHTPRIAHELGLKTLVGAWIGPDAAANERELCALIEIARAGHADLVAVGNEVLLRRDLDEDTLLEHLARVKAALPGVAVATVDAYYLFEQHPRVSAACDVLLANCYPFWEGCALEQAPAAMREMVRRVQALAGARPVIVSETGWPDRGSAFHAARPSPEGALRYFVETQRWAHEAGVAVFHFCAFDEAWKVADEGDVGAHWGLWDCHARLKFG